MVKGYKVRDVLIGLAVGAICLLFAFKNVEFHKMWEAFKRAQYLYFIPALAILFFSHLLRAWRWQFLLSPVAQIRLSTLYSALLIGYMVNTFLPAHLGEIFRAYIVGKKDSVSGAAVFGTIVTERIIDVFTLLILMALSSDTFASGFISF